MKFTAPRDTWIPLLGGGGEALFFLPQASMLWNCCLHFYRSSEHIVSCVLTTFQTLNLTSKTTRRPRSVLLAREVGVTGISAGWSCQYCGSWAAADTQVPLCKLCGPHGWMNYNKVPNRGNANSFQGLRAGASGLSPTSAPIHLLHNGLQDTSSDRP